MTCEAFCGIMKVLRSSSVRVLFCDAKVSAPCADGLSNYPNLTGGFAMPRTRGALPDRFWARVNKDGPVPEHRPELGPCWLWLGAKSSSYGTFTSDGKTQYAHRLSYEVTKWSIPNDLELDHLCRNPPCVNPDHLEPVTHKENMRRGKRASAQRCSNGHKFTPDNTYIRPDGGGRQCRKCNYARTWIHRHQKGEATC